MQQLRDSLKTTGIENCKTNPFGPMLDENQVNFKDLYWLQEEKSLDVLKLFLYNVKTLRMRTGEELSVLLFEAWSCFCSHISLLNYHKNTLTTMMMFFSWRDA